MALKPDLLFVNNRKIIHSRLVTVASPHHAVGTYFSPKGKHQQRSRKEWTDGAEKHHVPVQLTSQITIIPASCKCLSLFIGASGLMWPRLQDAVRKGVLKPESVHLPSLNTQVIQSSYGLLILFFITLIPRVRMMCWPVPHVQIRAQKSKPTELRQWPS